MLKKLFVLGCTWCNLSYSLTFPVPQSMSNNMSVLVINAKTGKTIYSHNAGTPRLVASNMKLITAAVALKELNPDFRWHTKLFYTGTVNGNTLDGNLYLLGGGDPTIDDRAINEIFSQLEKLGIKKIKGDLILDTTIFNSKPTYSMLKIENYDVDTILPAGLIVDGNISRFTFHVNKQKITIDNNLYGYEIKNKLTFDSKLIYCTDLSSLIDVQDNKIVFKGSIAAQCNNQVIELNLVDNENYTKMAINRALDELSIKLKGQILYQSAPNEANLVYDYSSQSLEDALIYMNHYSVNLIAEAALLTLGAYTTSNTNTYNDGKSVYNQFMQENHLTNSKFKLENGAGLSRTEFVSAVAMGHLLLNEANSQNFEATLPRSGMEGSLKSSFANFQNRVLFKTGTLNDTRAYSGYFYNRHGTKYVVVAIVNNVNTNDPNQMITFNGWVNKLLSKLDK